MKIHSKIISRIKGFTIVEVLVVVTIIVILTGIVVASLSGGRAKARDSQRVSDLAQIQLALALYVDRCGQYPTTLVTSAATGCPSGITLGVFMNQIPVPPSGTTQSGSYGYDRYVYGGKNITYVLYAKLEKTNPAVLKGMAASNIPDPTSSVGIWAQAANQSPWNGCSNADTSTEYCVGPN